MKKLQCNINSNILLSMIIIFTTAFNVQSAPVSISGVTKNISGNPVFTQVLLIQLGDILPGGNINEEFQLIARSQSNKQTGKFTINFDNAGIERLAIAARYGSPEYYIFQELDDYSTDISQVTLLLPEIDKNKTSFEWRIVKNGVTLDSSKIYFAGTLVEIGDAITKRTVNFTSREYMFNSDNRVFNLPNGNYRIKFAILEDLNKTDQIEIKTFNMTLPLSDAKIFSFEYP